MERGPLEVANSLWWPEQDLAEKPLEIYFQFTSGVNIRTHYVPGSTSSAAITRVGILGGGGETLPRSPISSKHRIHELVASSPRLR